MKFLHIKFYFLIIFLLYSLIINGQTLIHGKLILDDSVAAVGGFITLVNASDSLSMLDFTTTNNDGSWNIRTDLTQKVLLKTSYVSYDTYLHTIDLSSNDSFYVEIKLKAKVEVIANVEVVAKVIDIVQKGDTINYNVKNFLTGSEQTLGDVLQKMPGFEVNSDGTITYNGQKIDKLLVEGKDILNDQHQLATEGIDAKDLLKVQIIDKFTDAKDQFSNLNSDKIALNIDLDNNGKTAWNTNMELGAGYDKKYKLSANSIGISKEIGISIFGKINNTGENVLSANDYFNLQTERNLLSSMNNMVNGIEGILPKSFTIPTDLQKNQDELIAANFSYSPTDKLQFKTSILGVDFNRQTDNNFIRNYIGNEQIFSGKSQSVSHLPLLELQSNFQYQFKDFLFFEIDVPFSWQNEIVQETKEGFFNQNLLYVNNENTIKRNHIFPQLYTDFELKEKTHLIGKYTFQKKENINNLSLQGQDTLFNINLLALEQMQNFETMFSSFDLNFRHDFKKTRLGIDYEFTSKKQNLDFLTQPSLFQYQAKTKLNTKLNQLKPYLQYNKEGWYFRVGINLNHYQFQLNDSLNYKIKRLNPTFALRYNFSKLHFVVFSINRTNQEQTLNNLNPTYQIQNPQTLYQGVLSPEEMPNTNSFGLTYVNFNIATQAHYSLSMNYTTTTNVVSTETFRQPNFIVLQPIIQPYQNNFNGRFFFNKKIFNNNFSFKTSLSTQFITSTVIQQNQVNEWNYQSQNLNFEISKKNHKVFNYSIGSMFTQQRQVFSSLEVESYFRTIQPLVTIDFHKNNWTVKSDCQYLFALNNLETNEFLNWNMNVIYQPKKKPYTFSLIGNNLLNLHGQAQIQSNFNAVFVDIESFNTFPGFILLMCKYRF